MAISSTDIYSALIGAACFAALDLAGFHRGVALFVGLIVFSFVLLAARKEGP